MATSSYPPPFRYAQPLKPDEIRLLQLHEKHDVQDASDPQLMKFVLTTKSLSAADGVSQEERPAYTALSYVWGGPNSKEENPS